MRSTPAPASAFFGTAIGGRAAYALGFTGLGVGATRFGADVMLDLLDGVTGSGKSTLARRLGDIIGLPATSVDDLTWSPGWVAMPSEEQRVLFAEVTRADAWILDSAYGIWRDLVLERADLVVALDYPRWLSLGRLVRRCLSRIIDRKPVCNGNTETLRDLFARDSIVVWHFKSFPHKRTRMRAWAAAADGPPVILLSRPAEAADLLERDVRTRTPQPG